MSTLRSYSGLAALAATALILWARLSADPARADDARCSSDLVRDATSYDRAQRTACHNCFEKQYASSLRDALQSVSAIEIDFWDDEDLLFGGGSPKTWFVRHLPFGGNDNNVSAPGDLAAALRDVRAFSDAAPDHEVITVYLDKKQDWSAGRLPADFDAAIKSIFPPSRVFTPASLRGAHPTLRAAAANGSWPALSALRGKIIFVLTGRDPLHRYVIDRGAKAIAFVAPDTDEISDVILAPDGFDDRSAEWVVFHNLEGDAVGLAPLIRKHRRIARLWGLAETEPDYRAAIEGCVNFVAVYNFTRWL